MKKNILIVCVITLIGVSCNNKAEQTAENDSGFIQITKAQFESEKMEIGAPLMHPFADAVDFTGSIMPAADGQVQISVPLSGIIDKIYSKPGQIISKGAAIFEVSSNEFVDLQKDFAESAAIISRLKIDYLRAKELFSENISTQKDFSFAESNYHAENAKYKALKIKLQNIELDVLKIEKADFYTSYTIKSPIDGFVSSIRATMGQFIEPQQNIAEIINDK